MSKELSHVLNYGRAVENISLTKFLHVVDRRLSKACGSFNIIKSGNGMNT